MVRGFEPRGGSTSVRSTGVRPAGVRPAGVRSTGRMVRGFEPRGGLTSVRPAGRPVRGAGPLRRGRLSRLTSRDRLLGRSPVSDSGRLPERERTAESERRGGCARLPARGCGVCFEPLLARGCGVCFERLLARGWLREEDRLERLLARGWLREEDRLERLLARGWLREEDRLEEELALADDFDPDDFDDFDDFERSAPANASGITSRTPSRTADHQPARRCELRNLVAIFHILLLLLLYCPVSPTPAQAPDVVVS